MSGGALRWYVLGQFTRFSLLLQCSISLVTSFSMHYCNVDLPHHKHGPTLHEQGDILFSFSFPGTQSRLLLQWQGNRVIFTMVIAPYQHGNPTHYLWRVEMQIMLCKASNYTFVALKYFLNKIDTMQLDGHPWPLRAGRNGVTPMGRS